MPQCYVCTCIACLVCCLPNCSSKRNMISRSKVPLATDSRHHLQCRLLASQWGGKKSYFQVVALNILLPCELRFLTHSLWRSNRHKDLMICFHISYNLQHIFLLVQYWTCLKFLQILMSYFCDRLYRCNTDVHLMFSWIHCIHFRTSKITKHQ